MGRHQRKFLIAAAAFGALSGAAISQARDHRQYSKIPQEIREWIKTLADGKGLRCCAMAEGTVPDEFTWDIGANHYRVKVYGRWLDVPESAVVKGPTDLGGQ